MKLGTRAMYRYVGPDAHGWAVVVREAILAVPMYIVESRTDSRANAEQTRSKLRGFSHCITIEWGRHGLGTSMILILEEKGKDSTLSLTERCSLHEVHFPIHDPVVLRNFEKFLRVWVRCRAALVTRMRFEGGEPFTALPRNVGRAMQLLHERLRFHYDLASQFLKVLRRPYHPSMADVHRAFSVSDIVYHILHIYWNIV